MTPAPFLRNGVSYSHLEPPGVTPRRATTGPDRYFFPSSNARDGALGNFRLATFAITAGL